MEPVVIPTGNDMHVEMKNCLPACLTTHLKDSGAVRSKFPLKKISNVLGSRRNVGVRLRICLVNIFHMVLRNYQSMAAVSRKNVEKGVTIFILENFMRRNRSFDYLAEDAL
jgi:hypothetical protein